MAVSRKRTCQKAYNQQLGPDIVHTSSSSGLSLICLTLSSHIGSNSQQVLVCLNSSLAVGLEISHVLTKTVKVTDLGHPDFRVGVGNVVDKELDLVDVVSG